MKDEEEYRDYLVEKARELLNQDLSEAAKVGKPEVPERPEGGDEPGGRDIPFAWDPREVEHLARNRKKMDNGELKQFLEREDEFHEELEELDEWQGFSRWEERFMVQHFRSLAVDEIAEELGRDAKEVRLKMRMLGMPVKDE